MRIVVDLQCCQNASRERGIGRYALAMTRALATAGLDHQWFVLLSNRFPDAVDAVRSALAGVIDQEAIVVCALPERIASADPANAWRVSAATILREEFLAALRPDLIFMPSFFEGFRDDVAVSLPASGTPTAVTVHDFIPLEEPWRYLPTPDDELAYARRVRALRHADLVLAISSHSAGQATRLLQLAPDRVVVVPNGVSPSFTPGEAIGTEWLRAHGIDRPFVLNTSPIEHRKNIHGLIRGFAAMPSAIRVRHQLVVVGRVDEHGRRRVAQWAAQAKLPADAVVLTGPVSDRELVALYAGCAMFAFPSLSEGFGLPPLEAMACGAPVIASNTTSLPEVIGRPDALIDPSDPDALGEALAKVLDDAGWRRELSAYGLEQARRFSWEASAIAALAAFERLATTRRTVTPTLPVGKRLTLILPSDDNDIPAGKATSLISLLPRGVGVDLIGGGQQPDLALDALVERRSLAWFDRHAATAGVPIYLSEGDGDPAWHRRIAVHGGLAIRIDGWWRSAHAASPQRSLCTDEEAWGVLPVAASPTAARDLRSNLGISDSDVLAIRFSRHSHPPVQPAGKDAGVRIVDVDPLSADLGQRYRTLIAAADLLVAGEDVGGGLLAQLRADAEHAAIPLLGSITDVTEPMRAHAALRRTHPVVPVGASLRRWAAALTEALEAPAGMLRRIARRLPGEVSGQRPSSEDLTTVAQAAAANAAIERLPAVFALDVRPAAPDADRLSRSAGVVPCTRQGDRFLTLADADPISFRPGDVLIGLDAASCFEGAEQALRAASRLGVALVTIGDPAVSFASRDRLIEVAAQARQAMSRHTGDPTRDVPIQRF